MLQQCVCVSVCIPSSAPKVTFFSQAPVAATAAADQQRTGAGTTLQKKKKAAVAAADDPEAWAIRQSIRLSGSLLPVNHPIFSGGSVRANGRSRCVHVEYVPIYTLHLYILRTRAYIIYTPSVCILCVIILLLRSRCTCRNARRKRITIDGQRNKKPPTAK